MRFNERRQRFRAIFEGRACVNPGSVFDPISARIAEDLGFECGMFAGSTASLTILGAPDHILITLSEFAEQARRICRAVQMPLMVDADHGYGNALNVMRTVEELETAGVAGLSIEDTALPMPHGSPRKARLLAIEEGVGKMKAAVAARRDPALVIAARTMMGPTSIEDVVARVAAYQETGVDAIFLVNVKTADQLDAVAGAARLPLILGNAPPELGSREALAAKGVRVSLVGHQPFAASVQALHDTLQAIREGKRGKDVEGVASPELMQRVTRGEAHDQWIDDFLGGK